MRLPISIFILFFFISNSYCQHEKEDSLLISFANTFGITRHFYPHKIKTYMLQNFLAQNVNKLEGKTLNEPELIKSIFQNSFSDIRFSESRIIPTPLSIEKPVYWQHLSCGPPTGFFYKSVIVNVDSLAFIDNGLFLGKHIESETDSIHVLFDCNSKTNSYQSARISMYAYGWDTGVETSDIFNLSSPKQGVSLNSFKNPTNNVYFKLFMNIHDTIDLDLFKIAVLTYRNGICDTIFKHAFNNLKVPSELSIGKHHSTKITVSSTSLNIKATNPSFLNQLFPVNEDSLNYYEYKLRDNLFAYFPQKIDVKNLKREIEYPDYDENDFKTIAKCALIETYCRIKYFDPNLMFVQLNLDSLLIALYHKTNDCKSEYDVSNLLSAFMVPLHDGHASVSHPKTGPRQKCLNFDVQFVKQRCYVVRTENELFKLGDEILSINHELPVNYLNNKLKSEQGSYQKARQVAELFLMCEDSTSIFHLEYLSGKKRQVFESLPKSPSAIGIWAKNGKAIKEIKKNVYLIDLFYAQDSDIKKLLTSSLKIKGIILDARKGIRVEENILTYLTSDSLFLPIVKMPQYGLPNQEGVTFMNHNENTYKLGKNTHNVKTVLITTPRNFSTHETFVHMAKQISSLKTIGEPTGGCNGVYNTFRVIGGYEICFTGTVVFKQSNEQLYNIGFVPNVAVTTSVSDIKKGRDSDIRTAIKVLRR